MRNAYNEEPFSLEVGGRTVYGMIHHAEHPKAVVISAHGLNGERVANTPNRSFPPSLGGLTVGLQSHSSFPPRLFASENTQIIHR